MDLLRHIIFQTVFLDWGLYPNNAALPTYLCDDSVTFCSSYMPWTWHVEEPHAKPVGRAPLYVGLIQPSNMTAAAPGLFTAMLMWKNGRRLPLDVGMPGFSYGRYANIFTTAHTIALLITTQDGTCVKQTCKLSQPYNNNMV